MVLSSRYLAGMTAFTTFSIRLHLISSRVMSGLCCTEITTVWTRRGSMAPMLSRYSTVTYRRETKKQRGYSFIHNIKGKTQKRWSVQDFPCEKAYLWFGVWLYPRTVSIPRQLLHPVVQFMSQKQGQRHALLSLIRGIAKHQALKGERPVT